MSKAPTLHLASTSPRRREILQSLGLSFEVQAVAIDETPMSGELAPDMVLRLAAGKAAAATIADHAVVLGSDTAVVLGEQILGKPRDADDAVATLLTLSGKTHRVMTGVALRSAVGTATALSVTEVQFREIGRDEAVLYWQSGEPQDKAGAYAIQGLGGSFVERISGSYSGVVGLPVFETTALLRQAGIDVIAGTHD